MIGVHAIVCMNGIDYLRNLHIFYLRYLLNLRYLRNLHIPI